MLQLQSTSQTLARPSLSVTLARSEDDVRAAQALRYRVFVEEMGARLNSKPPGLDKDVFDPYCDHLLVRNDDNGEVIGTYRILPPHQARRLRSCYSDTEFDLTRLQHLRPQMVEVGRSCVHPDHRSGAAITLLWAGLADYMQQHGHQYLIGCASVSMVDGGHIAANLYKQLAQTALTPVEWRVFPRCALPVDSLANSQATATPPLIKGYLRAGAMIGGLPAWDPDFNTADFFMLLPFSRLNQRYARHFLNR
ncbi:GNAT family N-acetyltransferase [Chitinibacteraceae bacterium HSL-7]